MLDFLVYLKGTIDQLEVRRPKSEESSNNR